MYCVGLISGTSLDGIDACIVKIEDDRSLKLHTYRTYPYPEGLKEDVLQLSASGSSRDVCIYNVLLGRLFSNAARRIISESKLSKEVIGVIGSHGQTVWHNPSPVRLYGMDITATLQLGEPSVIANETGIITVGDFRTADMSASGVGAPLVPYLDRLLLQHYYKRTGRCGVNLNIGGISNLTCWVPPRKNECKEDGDDDDDDDDGDGEEKKNSLTKSEYDHGVTIAFDCGPGNMLIDAVVQHYFNCPFDEDGKLALHGEVCEELLKVCCSQNDFVATKPPKSTGREMYGSVFVESVISAAEQLSVSPENVIRTVTEFTVEMVYQNFVLHVKPSLDRALHGGNEEDQIGIFVSGGGVKNKALMICLQSKFGNHFSVASSASIGVNPEAKEAMCFALLAYETLHKCPSNVPDATGASKSVILGKLCLPYC